MVLYYSVFPCCYYKVDFTPIELWYHIEVRFQQIWTLSKEFCT